MSDTAGYYRHPTVANDRIVFVSEGDLWTVGTNGGIARRLTSNPGTISFPCLSPDGKRVAFTGRDDGPPEVYVMDAEGGEPTRLTWLGSLFTMTVGWSRDGKSVLLASDTRQPFRGYAHLWEVAVDGGPPRPLGFGPARAISFEPKGPGVVIGRNSGDPARWKRYRGGTAGTLWVDRDGKGEFEKLIDLPGNLASPMWIGSRIYFLSDHEGHGNLYSVDAHGKRLRRHTDNDEFYVRFPKTDGRRIVYHAGADLHVFDARRGQADCIDVRVRSTRPSRNRKFVPAPRYLEALDLHPNGHSAALVARGGLFSMPLWEGVCVRHGETSSARHRLARWSGDGKSIFAICDEGGEEALFRFDASGSGRPKRVRKDVGRPLLMEVAPKGDRVAITNERQEVIIVDTKTGRAKTIERARNHRIDGIAWSPDGKWLAYDICESRRIRAIHVAAASTGRVHRVTRPDFIDYAPSWDPEGRYLYFLSERVFDPVYDSHYFDLGFQKGGVPMLIPLTRDAPSPFADETRPLRAPGQPMGGDDDKEKKKKGAKSGPPTVKIDFAGIEDRVVVFPVDEGRYSQIVGAPGRVLFVSWPVEGSLGVSWRDGGPPAAKGLLEAYDFDSNEVDTVIEGISGITRSADAQTLAVRIRDRIRVVPSSIKREPKPPEPSAGRSSGWIDLGRVRLEVEPGAEWRQMYREAWRLQRDQFWTDDMSKVDWKAVHDRYLPLVDRVARRDEFSDLMWEVQGELGTSHCYEMGGDYAPEPAWHLGFLGADVDWNGRRRAWTVKRIPRGDSWDEDATSPLAAPGCDVKVGDEIIAVSGERVGKNPTLGERLVDRAGDVVSLTIRRRRGKSHRNHEVLVRAMRDEAGLRYRDWVEANRDRVHKASRGRIGYVHIPNMGPHGFAEFHRYFRSEVDRDGLVIDVRWNGGGHVSQLLLQKLMRKRVGYDANRWSDPEPYPSDAPMGPIVALTNEYAGSDGDIFSHCFKLFGLGPLIGKRTWGGVVGIWPRHALVDGTITTQPEFAFWFEDVEWGVENYGTDPDIEVEILPQDHAAGRDPQLERGIDEARKLVRKLKPKVPAMLKRPSRKPPRLGKR